jgi:hypothetical protein
LLVSDPLSLDLQDFSSERELLLASALGIAGSFSFPIVFTSALLTRLPPQLAKQEYLNEHSTRAKKEESGSRWKRLAPCRFR